MTKTEVTTQTQETLPTQTPAICDDMPFSDYEKMRRGELVAESQTQSALATEKGAKPNESEESETLETEASESEDESTEPELKEDEGEEEESEKDKPKKEGGFQRRIKKLIAQREDERRQREALEARLAQLEKSVGEPKATKVEVQATQGEPEPEDFETHKEYVKALTKWELDQREKAREAQEQRSKLEAERETLLKSHSERVKAFSKKQEDFQEVLGNLDDVPSSAAMEELILSSENGPEILYELAKNPKEAKRIAALSPLATAREIGKIESKIALKASEEKKPEPKKITNAPKPIEPVGKGTAVIERSIYDSDIPFKEYERKRREEMKRRGA